MTEPTLRSFQDIVDEEEHGQYAWLLPGIPSTDGEHVVALCREIVKAHGMKCIDGVVVDVQTANAVITLADNLSTNNRAKFIARRTVTSMGDVAQKVIFKGASRQ